MTMLSGWTAIVTRPAHQAAGLAQQFESAGARVFAWPTLTIEPVAVDDTQRERWSSDRHDWLVFTSANAVEHASRLWRRPWTTESPGTTASARRSTPFPVLSVTCQVVYGRRVT